MFSTHKTLIVSLLGLMPTMGAQAQDAGHIAKVRDAKQSCFACNLFQADLSYRDIPGVDPTGSRLRQGDLRLSTMNGSNFSEANLSLVNGFGARFTRASFRQADLSSATLTGAYMGYADFTGATLANAYLEGADFTGARGLTQSQLNQACGDASTKLPKGLTVPTCR